MYIFNLYCISINLIKELHPDSYFISTGTARAQQLIHKRNENERILRENGKLDFLIIFVSVLNKFYFILHQPVVSF